MEYNGNIPILNKEQFETLLLIYAAYVDYEFTEEEKSFILSRCSLETFETMHNLFLSLEDFSCLRIIINYKEKYYPTKKSQDDLFKLLKEIFGVDGDYSRIEKVFVSFFKKIKHI